MIHAWRRLWQLAAGPHALALSDQAVVSGTSFLTIILVGRWTGSTQLGLFAIGMSVLASVIAAQDSLIVLPYAIQKHRAEGTPDQSAGNALALNFLLSGLAFTLIVAAAAALLLRGAESQVSTQAWALAAAAPFVLLREFGRRYGFAHLRIGATLALDAGAAALQLGLLFWLQWNGLMSAVSALCAIAVANGFAGAAWLLAGRRNFSISLAPARRALHESWSLGKWLFASVVTAQVQWYVTYWLSVIVLGAAAAGVYAACMSVVSFVNPLITGFGNILTPRAVLARHASGASGLRRQAIQDAVFIATALGSFTLLISFGGETIMRLLYPGDEYQGYGGTLAVLAAALLAQAIGTPASSGLATMERPKAIFLVGSFGALVTVGAVWALMLHYGLRGAAVGFLIGNIVGSAGRWAAFLTLVPHAEGEAEAARQVLRQFAQQPANAGLTVTRLGDGDHASVVGVRSDSGGPLWQGHDSLVLKLFKTEAKLSAQMMRDQYEACRRLHADLDGQRAGGWSVCAPAALFLCAAPPAIMMTLAPGVDLNVLTARNDALTPQQVDEAGRALAGALAASWARGRMHGDLALQNVLCRAADKTIALIDAGTPAHCRTCYARRADTAASTLDLAHLLSDISADVKRTIGRRGVQVRRENFVGSVLRAALADAGNGAEKHRRLAEIDACARLHLLELLQFSYSPRGIWRVVVKREALRRLDRIFASLAPEFQNEPPAAVEARRA